MSVNADKIKKSVALIMSPFKMPDGYYRFIVLLFFILMCVLGWRFVENGRFAVTSNEGLPYCLYDTRTGTVWVAGNGSNWTMRYERKE